MVIRCCDAHRPVVLSVGQHFTTVQESFGDRRLPEFTRFLERTSPHVSIDADVVAHESLDNAQVADRRRFYELLNVLMASLEGVELAAAHNVDGAMSNTEMTHGQ